MKYNFWKKNFICFKKEYEEYKIFFILFKVAKFRLMHFEEIDSYVQIYFQ